MVQIPLAARIFVLLVITLGIYTAAPNLWPRAQTLDLTGLPVAQWIGEPAGQVPLQGADQAARLLAQRPDYVFDGDLPDTFFVGPALDGVSEVVLLDGRRLPLRSNSVAIDCAVSAPFSCRQINLGLDLQGGAFASFEIAEHTYFETLFKEERLGIERLSQRDDAQFADLLLGRLDMTQADDGGWFGVFDILADVPARQIALAYQPSGSVQLTPNEETNQLILQVSGLSRDRLMVDLTQQLIESLRTRFDAFGISEPIIRAAGPAGRVYVELPGADGIPSIPPGNLRLCSVPGNYSNAIGSQYDYLEPVKPGSNDVRGASRVAIDRRVQCVDSEDIRGATATFDGPNPQVNVQLRPSAGVLMNELTKQEWSEGPGARFLGVILDDKVIRFDSFEPNLGTSFRIRGTETIEEATTLATILRAGALPAEITKLEESKVGPELGAAAIQAGQVAAVLAVIAVLVYMVISYGLFGLFANVALIINLILILGLMTLLGFTLSLPGIAGIVLTIGMAVDANVLVFERMREVWRKTNNVGQAIENGYGQALSTILDANITTFIAAVVLFIVGKGAIQGFAVTLSIGILTSIFSALLLTRMLIGFWYGSGRRLTMPI